MKTSQMASQIENLSRRDKFLFRHTLGLTFDTTSAQLQAVLDGCRALLAADRRVHQDEPNVLLGPQSPNNFCNWHTDSH